MGVSGDLATIDLADLLQNIEAHARTGTLTLHSEAGDARLHFRDGRIMLLARDGRMPVVEMLVAAGHVTQRRLDAARKKQRGSGRALVERLVGARVLPIETVRELAEERLGDDVANLIAAANGEFEFVEQDHPGDGFDPDEAALGLSLAVAPLVLEASRRVDDWAEIKKSVPSGRAHFRARDGAAPAEDVEDAEVAAALLEALDGSCSVDEVVEQFPNHRFQAFKLLAGFVRDRVARPVPGDELLAIAEELEPDDPARARALVERALETQPHHLDLLTAHARLSEAIGDVAAAVATHKLLAHLAIEDGRPDDAVAALQTGRQLLPNDASLWERSLQLALDGQDLDSAREAGLHLVELHRERGLHGHAAKVLERLLQALPDDDDLHLEMARTCVDHGDPKQAVRRLLRRAKQRIARARYDDARRLYDEVLAIEPDNDAAATAIEHIEHEEFARRRARRRRIRGYGILACLTAVVGLFVCLDVLARIASVEMRTLISRERMIERRQYDDAIRLWQQLRDEHWLTPTAWFEIPRRIDDLEQWRRLQSRPVGGSQDR